MAANQTSAIGVLFDVDYDVILRNGCFQRGTTLKFLKYFRTFFVSILGQRHGVIIPVKPIRMQPQSGGKSIFAGLFTGLCFEQSCRVALALVYLY